MMETKCAQCVVFLMCIVLAASSEVTNSTREESGVPSETCGQEATFNVYMDFIEDAIEKAKNTSVTCQDAEGECGQKEALMTYLKVAEDMMKKARVNFPTCNSCDQSVQVSKQVPKDVNKDETRDDTKDVTKDDTKDVTKDVTKDDTKDVTKDVTKDDTKDVTKDVTKDDTKDETKDDTKDETKDVTKDETKDVTKEVKVARDCSDVLRMGHDKSGVYTISPINRVTANKAIEVYCDMKTDGGGWTVIQRRGEFQNPTDFFYKDWKSYKDGFGSVDKEFWLGNDNIFALTNQGAYSARFDLEDVEKNRAYAQYESFYIDDESNKYALHLSQYSGDAGDSMMTHNNQKFTTKDSDNDSWRDGNCAQIATGAWWFNACYDAHLDGMNIKGKQNGPGNGKVWKHWKGSKESLLGTEIKVRPKNFKA